jgi:hypothetical protein
MLTSSVGDELRPVVKKVALSEGNSPDDGLGPESSKLSFQRLRKSRADSLLTTDLPFRFALCVAEALTVGLRDAIICSIYEMSH